MEGGCAGGQVLTLILDLEALSMAVSLYQQSAAHR
jgi:hypothetical protein